MKWFFGLILVIALIGGALYGVGYFLLPNELAVTRTAEIERPRAAVFAMVNDLRIAKEWSPYYAMDPDAEYAFSGEGPGAGQTMRWVSDTRRVGSGRMSIVDSIQNEQVESILELRDRATLSSDLQLRPTEGGTGVSWSVSAECAEGAVNVPCRYMNLILKGRIQSDLDNGLSRLKTLAEQLPDIDFEGLQPDFLNVEPQSYVYSQVTTSNDPAQVTEALQIGLDQVDDFMTRFTLTQAGPQMRVTTEWNQQENRMSFRVGYPFEGPTPLTLVGVQVGQTPSGPAVRVMHEGPRGQTRNTYAQIYAYLQAHRIPLREDGLPWEVIHRDGADGGSAEVEIFVPLQ